MSTMAEILGGNNDRRERIKARLDANGGSAGLRKQLLQEVTDPQSGEADDDFELDLDEYDIEDEESGARDASQAGDAEAPTSPDLEAGAVLPASEVAPPLTESAETRAHNERLAQELEKFGTTNASVLAEQARQRGILEQENAQLKAWHRQAYPEQYPQESQQAQAPQYVDVQAREAINRFIVDGAVKNLDTRYEATASSLRSRFPDFDKHVPPDLMSKAVHNMRGAIRQGQVHVADQVNFENLMMSQYKQSKYDEWAAERTAAAATSQVQQKHEQELNKLGSMPKGGGQYRAPAPKKTDVMNKDNRVGTPAFHDRIARMAKGLLTGQS